MFYFVLFIFLSINLNAFDKNSTFDNYLNLLNKISVSKQHGFEEFKLFDKFYILDNKNKIKFNDKNCMKNIKYKNEILTQCFYFETFDIMNKNISLLKSITIINNNFIITKSDFFNSLFNGNYSELYKDENIKIKKITNKKIIKELNQNKYIKLYLIFNNENTKINSNLNNSNYNRIIEFIAKCQNNKCMYNAKFINEKNYFLLSKLFYKKLKGI
jgi:hypothetical protein